MKILLILAVVLLSACGASEDRDRDREESKPITSYPIDRTITEQSAQFTLTHRYNGQIIDIIEGLWDSVEACSGYPTDLTTDSLHIQYIPVLSFWINEPLEEVVGAVWVDHKIAQVVENDLIYRQGRTTRHEMLHYILWVNGQNPDHDNPAFDFCNVRKPAPATEG